MFIPNQKALRRAFLFSIYGTRGGPVRLTLLRILSKNRMNINQISNQLKLDYKTVQHHMRVLEKSGFVNKEALSAENVYSLSVLVSSNKDLMNEIKGMGKSK